MNHLISALLALTLPSAALADSAAVAELGTQSGQSVQQIKGEMDTLRQDLSGKADKDHLFSIFNDTHTKTTYLDIREQQLEHPYLLNVSVDHGSEALLPASSLGGFIVVFHWNGEKIEVIRKDQTFRAKPGTPEDKAIKQSIADSVIAQIPMSSSDSVKHTIRFKADDLFLADLANLDGLIQRNGGAAVQGVGTIDRANSRIASLEAYPANVEAQARIMMTRGGGVDAGFSADPRRYAIEIHYSLSEVRGDKDYEERGPDGRVGYFTRSRLNYSNHDLDERGIPIETVIDRWNLQKVDPNAAVSDVKNPIVYWLDETIPEQYRPALKAGILAWNEAFEAAGFRNAVVVKDVEKDMTPEERAHFNPADASYNVVRWFVNPNASFADANWRVNPETGQILSARIRISDGLVRAITQSKTDTASGQVARPKGVTELCENMAEEAQAQLASGLAQLDAQGVAASEKTRFINEFLTWLASHESGHNMGLRHNFKGSEWLTEDQLGQNGYLTASVMDYVAPNMKAAGHPDQPFFQTKVGPYDKWAIAYGYGPKDQTKKVAAQANGDPKLAYAPDEDVSTIWGDAVDPEAQRWDLGKGAMSNARRHAEVAQKIWKGLPEAVKQDRPTDGVSLKRRFVVGFEEYHRAVANLAPVIGGVHVSRGDPGAGNDSFTPVSAKEQREALKFFEDEIFQDKNFAFDPSLVRKLGDEAEGTAGPFNAPINVQVQVNNLRADALRHLYAPAVLMRLTSRQEIAGKGDPIGLYDVMDELRHSIWSELERPVPAPVSSGRRTLQRMQIDVLGQLYANQGGGEERDAALRELTKIQGDVKKALASTRLDTATRAHLEMIQEQIAQLKAPKSKMSADDIRAALATK